MFKDRLKRCREEKKLSQTQVAEMLNITRQAYNHYETGNRMPTQETLVSLADLFNVSVDYLLGRTDDPNPADDIRIATFGDPREYTEEEIKEIQNFLEYIKSKRKK